MVKRTLILVLGMTLVGGVVWSAEVALTAAKLPPGTIVRISARRPAINLSRAEVVTCTNRALTVSHKREWYLVAESNLIDLVVLERPDPDPGSDPSAAGADSGNSGSSSDRASSRNKAPKTAWQRLLSFWK